MTTLRLRKLINFSPFWFGFLLIMVALGCFALSPTAQAVLPAPDGGYPGGNTAEGDDALFHLTTGTRNTAIGSQALVSNTTGGNNTAIGFNALVSDTTGSGNTANGVHALVSNTTGSNNTAIGLDVLENNLIGRNNTATGYQALFSNRGSDNTANGAFALYSNITGDSNTAIGFAALFNPNVLTTGDNNIALGYNAGSSLTNGNNNIDIGNVGVAAESNTIRIGTTKTQTAIYLAGILGRTSTTGTPVFVYSDGLLGTVTSSARFKDDIKPMDKASEKILALKPVTFRYKKQIDPDKTPQFGLVAEEVEKVNSDLVIRDKDGKPYAVRYEAVNAMLLNEFLKEHKRVEEQQATIAELKGNAARQEKISAQQQKQIDALTAVVQKVSAQLEVSKAAPQTALNNQ
jgi:hypothetical protein